MIKYILMASFTVVMLGVTNVQAATNLMHEPSQTFGLKVMLVVLAFLGYLMFKQEE